MCTKNRINISFANSIFSRDEIWVHGVGGSGTPSPPSLSAVQSHPCPSLPLPCGSHPLAEPQCCLTPHPPISLTPHRTPYGRGPRASPHIALVADLELGARMCPRDDGVLDAPIPKAAPVVGLAVRDHVPARVEGLKEALVLLAVLPVQFNVQVLKPHLTVG